MPKLTKSGLAYKIEPAAIADRTKSFASKEGRSILWILKRNVDEDALENEECAYDEYDNANERHDPVNARSRGPTEDEQSSRKEERPDYSGYEIMLLLSESIFNIIRNHIPMQVGEVHEEGQSGANLAG